MKVVIIEDESFMADLLREKIEQIDESISIVAHLTTIKDTIRYVEKEGVPDLFFSDIELTDGLSFEIFKKIENTTPVIFCTAYNQYAIQAFKAYGVDYLLKPFDTEDIRSALDKYYQLTKKEENRLIDYDLIKSLIREKKELQTTILVYQGEEIIPISSNNIALVGLEDGKVYLQSLNGKHYHVNQNIEQLAAILGSNFYRLNRQFIINRQCVDRVSYHFDRKLIAHPTFVFKEKLFVSKAKSREFLTWLESN